MDTDAFDIVKDLQQIRIDIQSGQRKIEDTITESLGKVDTLSHMLPEVFDLTTAIALCKAGYFVHHIDFAGNESMHYYNASLYYEDGTTITVHYLKENNMEDSWRIKRNPLEIDLVKLRDLHKIADDTGLSGESFEDCFK